MSGNGVKTFPAKFPGKCPLCSQTYPVSTNIQRHAEGWGHAGVCPPVEEVSVELSWLEGPSSSAEVSTVDTSASLDEETTVEKVDVSNADYNAIVDKLNALEKKMDKWLDEKIKPIQEKFEEVEVLKQGTTKKYQDDIAVLNEQVQQLQNEKYKKLEEFHKTQSELQTIINQAKAELQASQMEASALRKKKAELDELIAAQKRATDFFAKFKSYFEETIWGPKLRDFQKEDILNSIAIYEEGKNGFVNANVMGSGKTLEMTATFDVIEDQFFNEHGRHPRKLWVTKKSLKKTTFREIQKWNPDRKMVVVDGPPDTREFMIDVGVQNNALIVINYEMLNNTPILFDVEWDFIAMDEVHRLKGGASSNPTQIFMNARELLWDTSADPHSDSAYPNPRQWKQKFKFFMPLSGSPVQNHPRELWATLHLFNPEKFPKVSMFERDFVREEWDDELCKYVVRAKLENLLQALNGQVIRQPPEIIWASRPDKERIDYWLEHNEEQAVVYAQIKKNIIDGLRSQEGKKASLSITAVIAQLTYLREANVWPANIKVNNELTGEVFKIECEDSSKIDQCLELIEEINNEGEQVVVWTSQFTGPLAEIAKRLDKTDITYCVMDGSASEEDTNENSELFRQGKIDVILANRMSHAEGMNWHKNPEEWNGGARHAIFLDLWWNPEGNNQAEDRIWREGSKEGVLIHRLLIEDSVDMFILGKLGEKEGMLGELNEVFEKGTKMSAGKWADVLEELL